MGNKKPWNFCETPEEKCTMNYCDDNGCQNRKRIRAKKVGNTIQKSSGRAFVLERAKKHLGNKFKHFSTGQTLEEGYFTWSVSVSKFFGGMHVAYGGWVVWSASGGWLAEPCN